MSEITLEDRIIALVKKFPIIYNGDPKNTKKDIAAAFDKITTQIKLET